MKRDIVIDADSLLYRVAGNANVNSLEGEIIDDCIDIQHLITKFDDLLFNIQSTAEVEAAFSGWKIGKTRVIFSDPNGSFRNDIYKDYKANRKGRKVTEEFKLLKKWALNKYGFYNKCEADDIVSYYVRKKNAIGFSTDKDLLYGVAGIWYDMYNEIWHTTTKDEAKRFVALQTIAGDATDNIKGIPKIGMKTAEKLLDNDYSWENIVAIYKSKGLSEEDALLNRRLVCMNQVKKVKKGKVKIKLFKGD